VSKHRMPPGGAGSPKDTPDVPDEGGAAEEHTASSATEPAATAVEAPDLTDVVDVSGATPEQTPPEESSADEPSADEPSADEPSEDAAEESVEKTAEDSASDAEPAREKRRTDWVRVLAYGILPGIALILAMAAGYLKWQDNSVRAAERAQTEATQTAKDSTVKMLSYKPDTVDKDLNGARDLLTGDFRDQYTSLINDVVIPGAQQKKISAVATVPAVGDVSADPTKAVVLLFVNQTVVVGQDAPTDTASSVRVTLEKVGDRWLISKFDPV
jgi:Mce-associated membrane protein